MMTEEAEIIDLILASVIRRRDTTVSAHILTDGKSFKQFAEEGNIIIEQRHSSKLQKNRTSKMKSIFYINVIVEGNPGEKFPRKQ